MKTPEELGYEKESIFEYYFKKYFENEIIVFQKSQSKKYEGWIQNTNIYSQKNIDQLQIAYNNLKRDLKELNDGISIR